MQEKESNGILSKVSALSMGGESSSTDKKEVPTLEEMAKIVQTVGSFSLDACAKTALAYVDECARNAPNMEGFLHECVYMGQTHGALRNSMRISALKHVVHCTIRTCTCDYVYACLHVCEIQ